MRAEQHLEASFRAVLKNMNLPWPDKAVIEPSKDPKHGDLASNLALVSAKAAGMPPRELAAKMAEALRNEDTSLASVEVAGPGFLNVTFSPEFWRETIRRIDDAADRFGQATVGKGCKVQVEYVSANPTGPLHIGHGRGAAVGDTLARILRFASYDVTTVCRPSSTASRKTCGNSGLSIRCGSPSVLLWSAELLKKPLSA